MKNLVRGGVALSLIGMFVMIIFAQTRTDNALIIAKDSKKESDNRKLEGKIELNQNIKQNQPAVEVTYPEQAALNVAAANDPEDKKLVKKTVASKAAGRSRGSFTATAYCLRGRTATGQSVRRGIIAADPRVLKLGSKVTISGGGYSGDYVVSDTGGRIKGNKIDIWVASCAEARRFGRRTVTIFQ